MAVYKVIQDIEAEDKLLGPLTLKQFIYAAICITCLYLSFLSVSKNFPVMLVIFLPIAGLTGFFAFPWKLNQPTEVWALAKFRFLFKPRRRIWDQSGIKEAVTITAPKVVEHTYTDGLSKNEVQSRLKALADTIDSRGWAIKNVDVNLSSQPFLINTQRNSDRLVTVSEIPQEVPSISIDASDDLLDVANNPIARQFDQMIIASAQAHRQQIESQLKAGGQNPITNTQAQPQTPPNDYWFLNQPAANTVPKDYVTFNPQVVAPGSDDAQLPAMPDNPTPEEEAAIAKIMKDKSQQPEMSYGHMKVIRPPEEINQTQTAANSTIPVTNPVPAPQQNNVTNTAQPQQVTDKTDPAILNLANNNDLDIATLARQAKNNNPDEVVVSLH